MKFCRICGVELPYEKVHERKTRSKYCSSKCRKEAFSPPRPEDLAAMSPGSLGAWGELIVSADLMRRGWSVYRALSPSSAFDLAAYKDGRFLRIEVTMCKRRDDGDVVFSPHDPSKRDVLALVFDDSTIEYLSDGSSL